MLSGDNKYKCAQCNTKVVAKKQLLISRAPPVLAVHLKRFEYTLFGARKGSKIGKPVAFLEKLDLAPFCAPHPKRNNRLNTNTSATITNAAYTLSAVVVHQGQSATGGHYYSFVKSKAGLWHCMNDSHVRRLLVVCRVVSFDALVPAVYMA